MQTQRPGWSWPRFPWQRSDNQRFRQTPSSPDSQYGFSTNMSRLDNPNMMQSYTLINNPHHFGTFSWGPPPPYSDPNSPLRRNRYLYNQCQQITEHAGVVIQPISTVSHQPNMAAMDCNQAMVSENHHSIEQICATPTHSNHRIKNRLNAFKAKDSSESATLSDSDTQRDSTHSNTLPFRKARKKIENGAKSIGGSNQSSSRVNVQNIFNSTQNMSMSGRLDNNGRIHDNRPGCSSNFVHGKAKNCTNVGVENSGFQSIEEPFSNREYEKFGNLSTTHMQHYSPATSRNHNSSHSLPKDLTRYSICSAESEKTDYTDVSPMTPMTDDSNAIALAFQREMKNQQRLCKDRSGASGSNSNSTLTYSARYLESSDHSSAINRPKNVPEIHLRSAMQHMMSINNGASLDNLNAPTTLYQQVERKSVYQRPTYSFASAHSTSGHSHNSNTNTNPKHNPTTTPKKRNIYATHSLATPSNFTPSGDIDLVRLTNMRKEAQGDEGHSKTLSENEWPDLSNDRRL